MLTAPPQATTAVLHLYDVYFVLTGGETEQHQRWWFGFVLVEQQLNDKYALENIVSTKRGS